MSAGIAGLVAAGMTPAIAANGSDVVPGTTFAASSSTEQRALDGAYGLVSAGNDAGSGMDGGYGARALVGVTYDALSRGYLYAGLAAGPHYLKVASSGLFASGALPSSEHGTTTRSGLAPQDCAMVLAGLGIVGMVVRRRSHGF